ncbi:MAG: hypothetical protein EBR69_04610, partial [Synechococcaceae bacterium WB4_2_0805]|nr:hypothetical protein [Synechococcaceae bacterium WB4_2_0805]
SSLYSICCLARHHRRTTLLIDTEGYPFEVALPEGSGVAGVVLADQLKSLDWRARKAKLIERASPEVLAMVTARILPLLVPASAATQGQN